MFVCFWAICVGLLVPGGLCFACLCWLLMLIVDFELYVLLVAVRCFVVGCLMRM